MSSSVVTVAPGATLHDAARSMAERKVSETIAWRELWSQPAPK